jgi:hypothetical protein
MWFLVNSTLNNRVRCPLLDYPWISNTMSIVRSWLTLDPNEGETRHCFWRMDKVLASYATKLSSTDKGQNASLSIQIVAIWTFFMKDICLHITRMFLKFLCAYSCLSKTDHTCSRYLHVTHFSFRYYEFLFLHRQADGQMDPARTARYDNRWWVLV